RCLLSPGPAGALSPLVTVPYDFGVLPAGDADNNDLVDIVDFSLLRAVFGAATTCGTAASAPIPCADFDANGLVDIVDFSMWRSNFGIAGPTAAPGPEFQPLQTRR